MPTWVRVWGPPGRCPHADLSSAVRMLSQPRAVTVHLFLSFLEEKKKTQREPTSGYSKFFAEHVLVQAGSAAHWL